MSQPFHQTAHDRLEIRDGGGCLALFGMPFLLAGIFVILMAVRVVPLSNADEVPLWGWPLIGLMGLVFTAVGGGIVFGRTWTVFDKGRGSIIKQWGLLVPMKHESLSLYDYQAIVLRFDEGGSDSPDRYPVVLKAMANGQDLSLYSGTNYGEARAAAAQLAAFLNLPLEDATTPHATMQAAGQVDETLQDQLRRGADQGEQAARPLHMRSQIDETGGALRITIPGPGFRPLMLLELVIPIGILVFFAPSLLGFFVQTRTPGAVQNIFMGFVVIFFGLFPLLGFAGSVLGVQRRRTCVTVTPAELLVEERETWRTRATRIPAPEILGLDYSTAATMLESAQQLAERRVSQAGHPNPVPSGSTTAAPGLLTMLSKLSKSKGITVKARSGLTTFGAGLPDDEVRYLYSLVRRALAG